jgi:hypothetical protein
MIESSSTGQTKPTVVFSGRRRFDPWFYPLAACFLLAALLGTRILFDPDLGFHLKAGQWIVQNHQVPSKDTFTYTASDHDYLDIHWLYQVLLYSFYQLGGYSLISLVDGGCVLILLFLTWIRLRLTDAPRWMCVLLLTMVLLGIENRFWGRPETLSCILMSLILWILELRTLREKDLLFLLPFIFIIWANIEGLFAVGWGIVGIYCVANLLQSSKPDNKFFFYSALTISACLINPYFFRGLVFPFTLLNSIGSDVFRQAIEEFRSPWTMGGSLFAVPETFLIYYKSFCFFLVLLIAVTFRKRKIREYLLVVVFFGLSVMALRNIQLFLLACAPLAATCWKEVAGDRFRKFQDMTFGRSLAAWIFTLILLGLCLRVATGAYYASDRRLDRFGLGLQTDCVQAGEFLASYHLDGKMINHFNAGGWLDWQAPQKTFIDGRLEVMGEELFRELKESSAPGRLWLLIKKYQPDIIVFSPLDGGIQWIQDLQKMPDWRPVYLDGNNVIYLRKGYADQIPNLDYDKLLTDWGISKDISGQAVPILQTSMSQNSFSFWEGFIHSEVYPRWFLSMGIFCTFTGHLDTAEALELEGVRLSRGRYLEFYYDLRGLFAATNQHDAEYLCTEEIQETHGRSGFIQATGSVLRQ